jgi:hypothetical protein
MSEREPTAVQIHIFENWLSGLSEENRQWLREIARLCKGMKSWEIERYLRNLLEFYAEAERSGVHPEFDKKQ